MLVIRVYDSRARVWRLVAVAQMHITLHVPVITALIAVYLVGRDRSGWRCMWRRLRLLLLVRARCL